eukprot:TRINITY_DN2754_c0_g1_i2.p1 TRINITY_DN2754_c0_g1~~TRINITY_DN2754_c0_g1_i2.p1  ORF type:complete len:208 (+),score=50.12 TRINITY_DN2754_c0_g1_i2:40-624(+)
MKIKLNFTTEKPSKRLIKDFNSLITKSNEEIMKFFRDSFDVLQKGDVEIPNDLSKEDTSIFHSILDVTMQSLKNRIERDDFVSDLLTLGIEEGLASSIGNIYLSKFMDISRNLLQSTIHKNRPIDLQWQFGITTSNDKMNSVGSNYVQLSIGLEQNGVVERKLVEMSLRQFYELLGTLDEVKNELSNVSMTGVL